MSDNDPTHDVDTPEGSVWRKVRMSDTLFRVLGAGGVDWGEPDAEGFYTPTVYLGPDGRMRSVELSVDRRGSLRLSTDSGSDRGSDRPGGGSDRAQNG